MMFLIKPVGLFASCFLILATLTSCAKAPQASCEFNSADKNVEVSKEIAVIIAPNSGFVDFENVLASTLPKIQGLFKDKKNATLSVVLADGNPEIQSSSIIEVEKPFSSQTDIDDEVENAISEITRVYRCALGLDGVSSGASEESNLTLALSKAAGTFETPGTQREIFVLSNGISTAGQVNFSTDGVPTKDAYVDKVGDYEKALVDLQGANVTWIGLGQTDGTSQEEFDTQVIEALAGFWSLFVERSNGTAVSIKQGNVVGGAPNPNSLNISSVANGFEKICVSVDLGIDQGLVFKGNSAEFVDPPSTARASIEDIANDINTSSCFGKVIVTGYVSSDQNKSAFDGIGDKSLSLKRANAVKAVLEEFGVTNIEVVGAGWGGINEWDSDGTYNDVLGEKNRIVKIQEEK
jgi:hypothetical protein